MAHFPPAHFQLFFFPFFIGMWVFVMFILSKKGWSDLAANYKTEEPFTGDRIGVISASINGVNYNNSLVLKYNEDGIYLKPMLIFSLFHKPVLIPWSEVKEVRSSKLLFTNLNELIIGNPYVASIKMKASTYNKIRETSGGKLS